MKSFSDVCIGKRIACYGIGGEFLQIIKNYADYEWIKNISWLVDRNSSKAGKEYLVGEKTLEITWLENFLKHDLTDTLIFITCISFDDAVKQLESLRELQNVECYIFRFMFGLSEKRNIQIRQTDKMLIPPVIHYCWFGDQPIPDRYKRFMESWKKYCPDYEIVEWNESNCDIGEIDYAREAYEVHKYGFVPDYYRLKIIYENGGIYLDTDVELIKSLDDLRYNEGYCGLEFPGRVAFGLGFGAVKGNSVIKILMERYKQMHFINADGSLNEIPSPSYQTKDMMELGMRYGTGIQNVKGMTVYPIEVLSPQNMITGTTCITKNSYSIHYYDGTWVTGEHLEKDRQRQKDINDILEKMK